MAGPGLTSTKTKGTSCKLSGNLTSIEAEDQFALRRIWNNKKSINTIISLKRKIFIAFLSYKKTEDFWIKYFKVMSIKISPLNARKGYYLYMYSYELETNKYLYVFFPNIECF